MSGKSKRRLERQPWKPMREVRSIRDGSGNVLPVPEGERCFGNGFYTAVLRRREPENPGDPVGLHISYHRQDRRPVRDWRDAQRIKNDLVGPEQEMCELYPAESRMVDMANEYHLWGLEGISLLAFGWADGRQVQGSAEAAALPGARQRDGDTLTGSERAAAIEDWKAPA